MRWSVPDGVPLQPGLNVVTVTARDAEGRLTEDIITALHTPRPISVAWSADVALSLGENELTFTVHTAAGAGPTDVLTVTCLAGPPTLVITTPGAAPIHTTELSALPLAGTAIGAVPVTSVTWENDRGGSGEAILDSTPDH
jgi:hypothetical protein